MAKKAKAKQKLAKDRAAMSVKERRAAREQSGMSMKEFKSGATTAMQPAQTPAPTSPSTSPSTAPPTAGIPQNGGNFMTTAAGYQVERGVHSANTKKGSEIRRAESKEKYKAAHNDFLYRNAHHGDFDDDGYFTADTNKAMWQDSDFLRETGYKVGDTLWKPGSKDGLNGMTFTGKIRAESSNGNFLPEFEEEIGYYNKQKRLKEDSQFLNRYIPVSHSGVDGQHHADYFKNNLVGLEGKFNSTEKGSTEGLYKDKYYGDSHGMAWTDYVGTQNYDAEAGVSGAGKKTDGFYDKAQKYMADGGYAGDVLKQIDNTPGEKDRLSSPDQIAWYNSLIQRAKDFDWSATYNADPNKGSANADPRGKGVHDGRTATGHTSMKSYTPATYDSNGNVATASSNSAVPHSSSSQTPSGEKVHVSGHSEPSRPADVTPVTSKIDPAGPGVSVDGNMGGMNNNNMNFAANFFSGFKPQYKTSYKSLDTKKLQSSYDMLGFKFDPNRFNRQGQ